MTFFFGVPFPCSLHPTLCFVCP